MENLMDGLFLEIKRVREIRQEYLAPELNETGKIAAFIIGMDIEVAEQAIKENDVIKMLRSYSKLTEYEL